MKFQDLTGQTFGNWLVISRAESNNTHIKWLCECQCRNKTRRIVDGSSLKNGDSQSCGCKFKVITEHKRLRAIYRGMQYRCYNPEFEHYKYYGGKGIRICDEWLDYFKFEEWALSHGYTDNLTIERLDNEKDYCPDNCTWILSSEQAKNRTNARLLEHDGVVHSLTEWSKITGLSVDLISSRLKSDWSVGEALDLEERDDFRYLTYNGVRRSLKEWSELTGIINSKIITRIQSGWSIGQALGYEKREHGSKFLTYNNETHTMTEWCKLRDLNRNKVHSRLRRGWSVGEALEFEPRN